MEEAAAEMAAEEKAGNLNNDGGKTISRLPSFRPSAFKRVQTRQPSFFQKMFSTRQLDQALNEDDNEDKPEGAEGGDPDAEGGKNEDGLKAGEGGGGKGDHSDRLAEGAETKTPEALTVDKKKKEEEALEDDDDEDEEGGSKKKKNFALDSQGQKIYFPPIGKVGLPINVERLVNRNKNAGMAMEALMDMVERDVRQSIQHAKTVPVHPEIDRVQVTPEVSAYMAQVRSRRGVEKRFTNNMAEIQKSLTYRKSSVIMMNSNYSNKLVRKVEPIYVQEARSIVKPT